MFYFTKSVLFIGFFGISIVSYSQSGSLDLSFGTNGVSAPDFGTLTYGSFGNALAIQTDGKILVAGSMSKSYNGYTNSDLAIVRFNSDGSLDNSFGIGGIVTTNLVDVPITMQPSGKTSEGAKAITVLTSGKILVAGTISYDNYDSDFQRFVVVRYNANGTVDNSFGQNGDGIVIISATSRHTLESMKVQSDGKIVLGGQDYTSRLLLYRLNQDGSLDNTFFLNGGYDIHGGQLNHIYFAHTLEIQSDGKIIQSGYTYLSTGGPKRLFVSRFNADGTPDFSFNGGYIVGGGNDNNTLIAGTNDYGYSCALQSDGKILIGGGTESGMLVFRLNTNGTVDLGFGTNGYKKINSVYQGARSVIPLSNGKIVIAGGPWSGDFSLVGLNSNGSIDNTFGSNGISITPIGDQSNQNNEFALAAKMQNDGKILVAGSSSHYMVGSNYKPDITLVRYNGSGVSEINDENEFNSHLSVFPNPADKNIIIKMDSKSPNDFSIYNIQNQVMFNGKLNGFETTVNIENFPSGLYYIKCQTESGMIIQKFVKN